MASSNVSLIIPLVEAGPLRRAGRKATDLSRLVGAHFVVPRGFVISADAYRCHLWASGARQTASTAAEAEDREKIREAIISAEIPEDVWQAIADAYQRLSLQLGFENPTVAVRSSAIEDGLAQVGFPGAYESILNVSGRDALKAAIKRVWASLWSGKAAAYRARYSITAEPAMAIIIQQMMEGKWSGTVLTADPVTGNRNRIMVSCSSSANGSDLSCFVVDLQNPSAVASGDDPADSPGESVITLLAEKAIVVEKTLGGPVELEWTYDLDRLWFLQARPMSDIPAYFPDNGDDGVWKRLTSFPVSYFSRQSLLESDRVRVVNGYAYELQRTELENTSKQMAEGFRLLEDWQTKTGKSLKTDLESPDPAGVADMVASAQKLAGDVTSLLKWMEYARHYGYLFTDQLRRITDQCDINKLFGWLPGGAIMRDAHLQELADQFCSAEKSGRIDDPAWRRSYKADVEKFAQEYGHSFIRLDDMYDPAAWESWVENSDTVFRMIAAINRRQSIAGLITLHCAAEDDYHPAVMDTEKAVGPAKKAGFEKTLRFARGWLSLGNECEIALANASAQLRLAIIELGRKLANANMIADKHDAFHLALSEIAELVDQPGASREREIAALVAQRKHEIWLEARLCPPDVLQNGLATVSSQTPGGLALTGRSVCPGSVSGRIRAARSVEDAGEIECGEVLVVESPSLAWTPFLATAAGFIAQGECLQPGVESIIRTYGIPAITGCRGALDALQNGSHVALDASAGVVEINTQPSAARSV
ncbi:MAG: PEP/pyruvate-binding domain-containing protein [Armatimonadota bacterium]